MPRYIDADEVLETMRSNMDMQELYLPTHFIDLVIENMPSADVEPIKHGRWIETNDDTKKRCSECDVICFIAQYPHGKANFCPNCGAQMDGEDHEQEQRQVKTEV